MNPLFLRAPAIVRALCTIVLCLSVPAGDCAEANAPAVLSVVEKKADSFHWILWRADANQRITFLTAKVPPRHAFWSGDKSTVYYLLGDAIFKAPVRLASAQPAQVALVPREAGETSALWIDAHSNRLRIAQVEPIRKPDILHSAKGMHYRLKNGALVPASDDPPWGLPSVASVYELSSDGKWTLLAHRATKDEAGDTPGLSVIDDLRHENGFSTERLLQSYTCRSGICRNEVPVKLAAGVSTKSGLHLGPDDLSTWRTGPGTRALVFATKMGDEVHISPPLFLVENDRGGMSRLPTGNRSQLGIGTNGPLLLIEDEWSGKDPVVIDLNTGAVRFRSTGNDAVWAPM